jgi:hypothetical protein
MKSKWNFAHPYTSSEDFASAQLSGTSRRSPSALTPSSSNFMNAKNNLSVGTIRSKMSNTVPTADSPVHTRRLTDEISVFRLSLLTRRIPSANSVISLSARSPAGCNTVVGDGVSERD